VTKSERASHSSLVRSRPKKTGCSAKGQWGRQGGPVPQGGDSYKHAGRVPTDPPNPLGPTADECELRVFYKKPTFQIPLTSRRQRRTGSWRRGRKGNILGKSAGLGRRLLISRRRRGIGVSLVGSHGGGEKQEKGYRYHDQLMEREVTGGEEQTGPFSRQLALEDGEGKKLITGYGEKTLRPGIRTRKEEYLKLLKEVKGKGAKGRVGARSQI